jgi:hypothetical protein
VRTKHVHLFSNAYRFTIYNSDHTVKSSHFIRYHEGLVVYQNPPLPEGYQKSLEADTKLAAVKPEKQPEPEKVAAD